MLKTCPNLDKYCVACSDNKCLECYNSYLNEEKKCVSPKQKVENCVKYKTEGVCSLCKLGFYLNTNGKCSEITIKDCLNLESSTECQICKNGVLPTKGVCENSEKKCTVDNCNLCFLRDGVEKCYYCNSGYAILKQNDKFKCIKEENNTENCHYINPNSQDQCAICDPNYYWSGAKCVKSTTYEIDLGVSSEKIIQVIFLLVNLLFIL